MILYYLPPVWTTPFWSRFIFPTLVHYSPSLHILIRCWPSRHPAQIVSLILGGVLSSSQKVLQSNATSNPLNWFGSTGILGLLVCTEYVLMLSRTLTSHRCTLVSLCSLHIVTCVHTTEECCPAIGLLCFWHPRRDRVMREALDGDRVEWREFCGHV